MKGFLETYGMIIIVAFLAFALIGIALIIKGKSGVFQVLYDAINEKESLI